MKFSAAKIIGIFALSILLAVACSKIDDGEQNRNSAPNRSGATSEKNDAQTVKDDVEELEKIINLPLAPQEATWREEDDDDESARQNGENRQNDEDKTPAPERKDSPAQKTLTAVLRFSPEDAGKIAAQAEKYKPPVAAEIDAETWFPAELVAQSQMSGEEILKGALFAADDFFRAPYNKGKLTRIDETNYFVLELSTE